MSNVPMTQVQPEHAAPILGRYRVDSVLGTGGMASVLRVFDLSKGKALALKRLYRDARPRHLALFEREYHTLAGLKHPHVVEVYEYEKDAEGPFYTMELLRGEDLRKAGPLPFREACAVLRDVASALSLLHVRRLVHRDVSARNVFRTDAGCIKLIDFGTLSAFGPAGDVAGTPPFTAPEAVYGQTLDSRSDLYSLGALGYYLLTGVHAYPVRTMAELGEAWKEPPPPPSQRTANGPREPIPAALDELIEALLSKDPSARPGDTAEVIGRLTAVASLPSDTQHAEVQGYLGSKTFVGRVRERQKLVRGLERLSRGKGQAFVVQGPEGMGRSRLMSDLAVSARLGAATVIEADALALRGPVLAVAEHMSLALLDAAPAPARRSLVPRANVLGHVSRRLRERLDLSLSGLCEMPPAGGEARMRMQAALRDAFIDFAGERPLVILIDNAEHLDEGSAALLAALAHDAKDKALLLVASLPSAGSLPLPVEALHKAANLLELEPLRRADTDELLRSVFGDAPHLGRLSEILHERARGRPGRIMDLAEHLVRTGVVQHADGVWLLPQHLPDDQLPASAEEMKAARLERLSAEARALGRALAVHEGKLSLELCGALWQGAPSTLFAQLEALVTESVLVGTPGGYRFRDEATRRTLSAELGVADRARIHRSLGEHLSSAGEIAPLAELSAGLHLLLGGDEKRGSAWVARAGKRLVTSDHGSTGLAAPALETAVAMFRAARRSDHELIALLAPLTLAGYYHERRYAATYAVDTIDVLRRVLGLGIASRLSGVLGRRAALYVGLAIGLVGFKLRKHNPRVPSFREALLLLLSCVAATTGVAAVCVDPRSARRCAQVLEPLTALGEDHAASLMYDFCTNLALTVEDRLGEARERWKTLIARLADGPPIRDLPEHAKVFYHAGALYACGVLESWRDSSEALVYAERLERLGLKLYELSADQVRMLYYANQGDAPRFEHYRERVEMHAIQRGTAWQVETWASGALITVALRTHDAVRMKHALEQLRRVARDVPSLSLLVRRAEGAYALLRTKPEALARLTQIEDETPLAVVGWARAQGTLARALNEQGNHPKAREVAERALSRLSDEDRGFTAMNLGLEIEHALSIAGLGEHHAASERLAALIARHARTGGALTLGALHEARARVALAADDDAAFRKHAFEMDRHYRATTLPSLIERSERLQREGRRSSAFAAQTNSGALAQRTQERMLAQRISEGGEASLAGSAKWALLQIVDYTETVEGCLFVSRGKEAMCVARVGSRLELDDVRTWIEERIQAAKDEQSATARPEETQGGRAPKRRDPDRKVAAGTAYRLTVLETSNDGEGEIVGALLLPDGLERSVPKTALTALAQRLASASERRSLTPFLLSWR